MKKLLLFIALTLVINIVSQAQYNPDGTISNTSAPNAIPDKKLTVTHAGSDGAAIKNTSGTFSTLDIDGFNDAAIVRFYGNGSPKWLIGSNSNTNGTNFRIFNQTGGLGEALTIGLANNNIGIGNTTPNAALQFGNVISNRRIVLWENANNDHEIYGLGINGGALRYQVPIGAVHTFYAATSATASNELMRITSDGKVGIGTITPNAALHVQSNRAFAAGVYNGLIYESTGGPYAALGLFNPLGGVALYGNTSGSLNVLTSAAVYAPVNASAFNVTSDIRVKKEIVNLGFENNEEYLTQIRKIQSATYRYDWEDATSRATPHIGFIAQTLPAAVVANMDKNPTGTSEQILGYNLSDMAGLTLMGLKAVDAEMQELKATIKALQAEIELLKKK